MYFKLALANVKKSYKDYLVYFLTLAFSICLFYAFNSFQAQQALLDLSEDGMALLVGLGVIMKYISVFIGVVLGFLVLYANNFIIKRRKRELATYMLLGMPQRKISLILIYETFFIGIISLVVGLGVGVIFSQLLTGVSAGLFEVTLNYKFIFSLEAFIWTIVAFAIIFLIAMVFNTFVLNRYQLIDLINADKQNEVLNVKYISLYVVVFIASLICLAVAYKIMLGDPFTATKSLFITIPLGIIGTLGFFLSLSGFLVKFLQLSKRLYYRKLNMFVLREVNSSVKSNFISMSIVCIMLLLSIGALSVGLTLRNQSNQIVNKITPYDASVFVWFYDEDKENHDLVEERILDVIEYPYSTVSLYDLAVDDKDILELYKDSLGYEHEDSEVLFYGMRLSEYNQLMKDQGKETLFLADNEVALQATRWTEKFRTALLEEKMSINVNSNDYTLVNDEIPSMVIGTVSTEMYLGDILIIPDSALIGTEVLHYRSYNLSIGDKTEAAAWFKVNNKLLNDSEYLIDENGSPYAFAAPSTRESVKEANAGESVILTYISVYLGIVFLLSSAVVLTLQQLSKASDNRKRYEILEKIGTDHKMMKQSILLQLSIYFGMPLVLAIVHSIVGVTWAMNLIALLSDISFFKPIMFTGCAILFVYGCYFLITYIGYKNVVMRKRY